MRKTNIGVVLALALSLLLVMAVVPAAAKKGRPPKPPTAVPVAVSMDAQPMWVHEGADRLRYTVTLDNKTSAPINDVTVKFTAAGTTTTEPPISDDPANMTIPANDTVTLDGFSRYVSDFFPDYEDCDGDPECELLVLCTGQPQCRLLASVAIYIGADLVTEQTMSTPLYPNPPCVFDESGKADEFGKAWVDDVCVWTLPTTIGGTEYGTGVWKITLSPTLPDNPKNNGKPIGATVSVRDGVPGNWCTLAIGTSSTFGGRWTYGDDPIDPIVGYVYLPGSENLPSELGDWGYPTPGLDVGMCLGGGAAGDYLEVGNPSSFYLRTDGDVTVEWVSALP